MSVDLFISCVSDEFARYRDPLRVALTRHDVAVKIQEDFKSLGGDTLRKLEDYIERCSAVVHFVGEMTGSAPPAINVEALLARRPQLKAKMPPLARALDADEAISYTHWEAWLALYFGCDLEIMRPAETVAPSPTFAPTDASRTSQTAHLARLKEMGCHPSAPFASEDNLVAQIYSTSVLSALVEAEKAGKVRRPNNLPFATLGPLFKGREKFLDDLRAALSRKGQAAVVGRALHGLGGVGKTRLAIEYAWRHAGDYSALLFVGADSPEKLNADLAALVGPAVLDLPAKEKPQDEVKIAAVLDWLEAHPIWLMILDNVDDSKAVAPIDKLLARLSGGHVIVTARASEFPAHLRTLELGTLDLDSATQFLLERTEGKRAAAPDDAAKARELADELDGLALGLEQAGAYIARQRIGFARYLMLWREKRESVLKWFDPTTMNYNHDVGLAATWATSVEKLSPESRRLLDRLAFFAPDPIPDSLLDVAMPGEAKDYDAYEARAGLFAYSLISRASGEDGATKGFAMHRLVQDFARRAMSEERRGDASREALGWVNAAFRGDPEDVRTWPTFDPLAPHGLAVAKRADEAGIVTPTSDLLNQLAGLLQFRARYREAEPLLRRALSIDEACKVPNYAAVARDLNNLAFLLNNTNHLREAEPLFRRALAINEMCDGPDHPTVAVRLNNLASLLRNTNRIREAETLYRRALAIDEMSYGWDHPKVAKDINNLANLLQVTNRPGEAEPLYRRALEIDEESYGLDHPIVAICLNNLGGLLYHSNRHGEAEHLFRRALAIDEASYGPDHPDVARDLNNVAALLQYANRCAEAEALFRRALMIYEASDGPEHPNVARELNNLGLLLQETNPPAEVEALFRRALSIFEASFGSNHPDVAATLNNLASLLQTKKLLGEAEPLFRRALEIDEASLGPRHPNVATRLNNLALLLQDTNRLDEAEPLFRRALTICHTSLGLEHPNTAKARSNLQRLESQRRRPSHMSGEGGAIDG